MKLPDGDWTIEVIAQKNNPTSEPNYNLPKLKEVYDLMPVDGKWHHVVLYSDGRFSIDGIEQKDNKIEVFNVFDIALDKDKCLKLYDNFRKNNDEN